MPRYILYKQSLLIKKKNFLRSNIKKECNSQVFRITLVDRLPARPRLTRCRGSIALTLNAKEAGKGRVHLPDDVIEKGRKERERTWSYYRIKNRLIDTYCQFYADPSKKSFSEKINNDSGSKK